MAEVRSQGLRPRSRVSVQHHDLLWPADAPTGPSPEGLVGLAPEAGALYRAVVEAGRPCAAAELAIRLQLPSAVVAVLATELVEAGLLHRTEATAVPSHEVAQRVLRGMDPVVPEAVKIVVAGPAGSGTSTLIGALSDATPARYEELIPTAQQCRDARWGEPPQGRGHAWEVVVRDVGWVALPDGLMLTLASHPWRAGCDFMWEDVSRTAAGALVLVTPAHITAAVPHITALQQRRVPFVLAVNAATSETAPPPEVDQVRDLLDVACDVPVVTVDARRRAQAREAVGALFRYVVATRATVPLSTDLATQNHPHAQEVHR